MKKILVASLSILLYSCGGSDSSDTTPVITNPNIGNTAKPLAASLVFPERDKECTEGTNFTVETSTVEFRWNLGANTTKTEVILTEISSGEERKINGGAVNKLEIPLIKRGYQYKWKVVSLNNNNEKVESPEWLFYNAGVPVENYVPFPAVAIMPLDEAKVTGTTIDLSWETTDLDSTASNNDIASYDLFFGETNPPLLLVDGSDLKINNKTGIDIVVGKTYYWRVHTIDKAGNKSISEVFSFSVE